MTQPVAFTQWSDAAQKAKTKPGWVPPSHQDRIAAYQIYDEVYWSHVDGGYKIMNRGLDAADDPLYVPSSRIIVDTLDRYIAPNLTFTVEIGTGSESTVLAATDAFTKLFAREQFPARYAAAKQDGIIKGDWGWHVMGDPNKPEGSRLALVPFLPGNYFPVYEDEMVKGGDPDKLMMVLLAEQVQIGDDTLVRVQRYEKVFDEETGVVTKILSSLELWESDKWFLWRYDDDDAVPVEVLSPPTPLPLQVTTIPVYHVPHRAGVGEVFGNSPMRGMIGVQSALNQAMTDEDLALALMGLGVYATDEPGAPRDDQGRPVPWPIYPGAVVENGKGLHKVEGLTALTPYTEHVTRLESYYADATGATDAARGRLEVQEAESGVALMLKLGPTLALAEKQDKIITAVHTQMFYDLVQMWFPALEGLNFTDVTVLPVLGDKLPVNRAAEVEMVGQLVVGGILSAASARKYLVKKGFADLFDDNEGGLILAEKVALAAAEAGDTQLEEREAQETAGTVVDGE